MGKCESSVFYVLSLYTKHISFISPSTTGEQLPLNTH